MEPWWGIFCLTFLCLLMHIRGQGDFDLADALDDPEPTKKPSSDIYPKPRPPYQPQPGNPDNSGNIYPRPKPMPRPQPGGSDNSGGGGGSYPPSHDGHGSTHGGGRYRPSDHGSNYGGDGYPSHGNPQDHLAFLDSRRQQDSKNSVSYRVRGAGDPGGGNGQLFPVQQEEELLQGK
ncbi:glycoprotein Xg isoform X4 [Balaenoptera acutorostrata]|uniref:Glycoprotein Xg isoform X4 n=1 Tax=Balaenoptera acutorostrata TaxID=9767 RepID=A0ABM3SYY8_BALAC|nr:glycoprotein Xg isoform X4 [Balaenoptera acutorostrata]